MQSMSCPISRFPTNTVSHQDGLLYHLLPFLVFMPWGRIYWHMCRRCQSKVLLSTAVGGESASHMLPALPKQSWLVTQFQPLTPHLLSLTFHSFSYLTRVATLETQRAVHLLFLPEGIWLRRSRQMLDPVIPPELTEGWVRVENTPPESCIPRPAPPPHPRLLPLLLHTPVIDIPVGISVGRKHPHKPCHYFKCHHYFLHLRSAVACRKKKRNSEVRLKCFQITAVALTI